MKGCNKMEHCIKCGTIDFDEYKRGEREQGIEVIYLYRKCKECDFKYGIKKRSVKAISGK